jgi:hypothetical protein
MWNPTNATAGVYTVGYNRNYKGITYYYYSLYSVTRSRYSNVVTANQILGARNTACVHERKHCVTGFLFMPGQEWMFDQRRAPLLEHTATTVVSADPSALNNTVGFCIDAGDRATVF